jgi:hypothetical protein
MTGPNPTDAPELISIGAQSIVDRSKSLGLVWTRRLATVNDGTNPASCVITFDNDTVAVTAVSMVGPLPLDTRVYVDMVPPSGNFITGVATTSGAPWFLGSASLSQLSPGGTTVSAVNVNMPGSPTITLTKNFETTDIKIDFHATLLTTLANTSVRCAVSIGGTDNDICHLVLNPASTHLQVSGTKIFTSTLSGPVAIIARWRRIAGGGTLTTGTDDWIAMSAVELV